MFCRFCGSELAKNANFCSKCGKINEFVGEDDENVENGGDKCSSFETIDVEDIFQKEKEELGGGILKFAILGIAFGVTGILSALGLAFSIVARSRLTAYLERFQETEGRATVGKSLSIAAMIVSIVCLISFVFGMVVGFFFPQ